jgi:hypothetical protein
MSGILRLHLFNPICRDAESLLRILGDDACHSFMVFVFGFDTTSEQGSPNVISPLAAVWDWSGNGLGFMSTDDKEDPLEGIRDLSLVF